MNHKIFCTKPFNAIFLGPDGGVRPCCSLTGGDLGNLNTQTLDEILHGELASSIRQSFIKNEWHPSCDMCRKLKEISPNLGEMKFDQNEYDDIVKVGSEYFKLVSMDLRWTNLCNLACNYCMPYFSSRWAQINGEKINFLEKNNAEKLLTYIKDNVDTVTNIMMLGGEPLLQKENIKLLEILEDKDVGIHILTNLSTPLDSNPIGNMLLKRNRLSWGISMETVGDRYEYVRDGASWEVLNKNIQIIKNNRPQAESIRIFPIYCLYSAFNLMELFDWANDVGITEITWQVIDDMAPLELGVRYLSKELKLEASAEIDRVVEKYSHRFDMNVLLSIKKEIVDSKDSQEVMDPMSWTLKLETEKLKNKKHTFVELWPDLANKLDKKVM